MFQPTAIPRHLSKRPVVPHQQLFSSLRNSAFSAPLRCPFLSLSGDPNSANQVLLFRPILRPNRERIQKPKPQRKFQRLIPPIPFPAAFISLITLTTVSGSESINAPTGLMRTKCTCTHEDFVAVRSASIEWHEQPCARIVPFCLASSITSITPRNRSVQSLSVKQCIKQMSR